MGGEVKAFIRRPLDGFSQAIHVSFAGRRTVAAKACDDSVPSYHFQIPAVKLNQNRPASAILEMASMSLLCLKRPASWALGLIVFSTAPLHGRRQKELGPSCPATTASISIPRRRTTRFAAERFCLASWAACSATRQRRKSQQPPGQAAADPRRGRQPTAKVLLQGVHSQSPFRQAAHVHAQRPGGIAYQ